MSASAPRSGLFFSLRQLAATALEIAQVRLELLSTESEFEKRRLFDGLLWSLAALLLLGLGLVLLCGFFILLLWDGYRLVTVGVLALLLLVTGVLLMREARQRLRNPAGLFSASLNELERDRAQLQTSSRDGQP